MVVKKKKKQFLVRVIIFVAHEECGIFCGGVIHFLDAGPSSSDIDPWPE